MVAPEGSLPYEKKNTNFSRRFPLAEMGLKEEFQRLAIGQRGWEMSRKRWTSKTSQNRHQFKIDNMTTNQRRAVTECDLFRIQGWWVGRSTIKTAYMSKSYLSLYKFKASLKNLASFHEHEQYHSQNCLLYWKTDLEAVS